MNISDELRSLQDLHQSGGLTDEEFRRAKDAVLARAEQGPKPARPEPGQIQTSLPPTPEHVVARRATATLPSPDTARRRDELNRQRALIELDKEWDRERAELIGNGQAPSRASSLSVAVLIGIILLGILLPGAMTYDDIRSRILFMVQASIVTFIVCAVYVAYTWRRALAFEEAKARYDRKRAALGDRSPPWPDEVDSFQM